MCSAMGRSSGATFCFGFQQLEQQGVHILRGPPGSDQTISEVVHPRDCQPVVKVVQVQIAFISFQCFRLLSAPLYPKEASLSNVRKNKYYVGESLRKTIIYLEIGNSCGIIYTSVRKPDSTSYGSLLRAASCTLHRCFFFGTCSPCTYQTLPKTNHTVVHTVTIGMFNAIVS